MKIIFILVTILTATAGLSMAVDIESVVSGPFVYEEQEYEVSVAFNSENNSVEERDIDGDGTKEVIAGFQGQSKDDNRIPVAFLDINGEKISGNSYFTKVDLMDIDNNGYPEVVFWSAGGAHYTQLDIYKYSEGQVKGLFNGGSACGVDIKKDDGVYTVRVGQPNWDDPDWNYSKEPLWETWEWVEGQNMFKRRIK